MKNAKSILAVLLCAMTLFTVSSSCTKESTSGSTSVNTNESTNERRIIGKWVITRATRFDYNAEGTLIGDPKDITDINAGSTQEYYSDGTCSQDGFIMKYSLEGDVLVVGDGQLADRRRIIELTNSTLIWERQTDYGSYGYIVRRFEYERQ
jgi:hypothetical protein